jgi:sarcosine oxidase
VLGLEQFGAAHDRGSSHGETRIIRKAYFEHPDYVPLLRRAYALWRELESESGRSLMHLCGLMLAGPPAGEAIPGAKLSAELHGLNIESVSPVEASQRFPGFRIPQGFDVVFEADAGYLEVENCVRAHIERARSYDAAMRLDETVLNWASDGRTVRVRTDRDEYEAGTLIVTAGAWSRRLLSGVNVRLTVLRKPVFWHAVTSAVYDLDRGAPAFYFEMPAGAFYGFPSLDGRTVKLAEHTGGGPVDDPAGIDRTVRQGDHESVRRFIEQAMPALNPQPVRHSVCMYTMTPDGHFLVDRHPEHANVVFGAGFSGHGFKFTSVLGEALADLALEGRTELPIGFLGIERAGLL